MALGFEIAYKDVVIEEDIPRLDFTWKDRVRRAIEERLTMHPEIYGKPLRHALRGFRKLRVGDYRIIFHIVGNKVLIVGILHRSDVYERMMKRI